MSLNRVVLVGRLTKDVDLRYTPDGNAVANFTIAANRPFKNQQGKQEADFINCVTWRKQAENLANYQKKGNMIGVDGRIQTRSFEGQDGKMVYITEVLAENIQFLEPRSNQGNAPAQNNQQTPGNTMQQAPQQNYGQAPNPIAQQGVPIDEDDLPF